jgi:hypothetical protein
MTSEPGGWDVARWVTVGLVVGVLLLVGALLLFGYVMVELVGYA